VRTKGKARQLALPLEAAALLSNNQPPQLLQICQTVPKDKLGIRTQAKSHAAQCQALMHLQQASLMQLLPQQVRR